MFGAIYCPQYYRKYNKSKGSNQGEKQYFLHAFLIMNCDFCIVTIVLEWHVYEIFAKYIIFQNNGYIVSSFDPFLNLGVYTVIYFSLT